MNHLSPEALSIIASLRAALAALDDHRSQPERQMVYEFLASHLRSASPLSLLGTGDTLEPLTTIVQPLSDGARYELAVSDGQVSLYVQDASKHDVSLALTHGQAEGLVRDMRRVMAGGVR